MNTPAPGGNRERAETSKRRCAKPTATAAENPAQPVYGRRQKPLFGIDGTRALRELLERAKQSFGLFCRNCVQKHSTAVGAEHVPEGLLDRRATWLSEADRRRDGR